MMKQELSDAADASGQTLGVLRMTITLDGAA